MKIRALLLGVILLTLCGCVIWPFPYHRSETPRVIGQVIDAETRLPLEGVELSIESTWSIQDEPTPNTRALSNRRGEFVLEKAKRPRKSKVIFLIGNIFGRCSGNLTAMKSRYQSQSKLVEGPLKSGHYRSVCEGIQDINLTIELMPE